MFKFLKEKISKWAKNVSKEKESEIEKEILKDLEKREDEEIKEKLEKREGGSVKKEPSLKTIEKRESFLKKITKKIGRIKISEEDFEVYGEDLKTILLENNVALEVSEKIIKELGERIIGKDILKKGLEIEIKKTLREIIEEILLEPFDLIKKINEKSSISPKEPFIILFMGINGTGKTTTIAKISHFLKDKGISSVLAGGDTFRAASIEQIKKHGENLNVEVISQDYGSDPAAVGFDAINYAKKKSIKVVLIDTAGRMHTSKNLLKEMEKIKRVCNPDIKLFIGEAITGNDVVEQAKSFENEVGIDGIILTKADIDERGGSALSVGHIIKKPIIFLGTGQAYNELIPFDKEKFIKTLEL